MIHSTYSRATLFGLGVRALSSFLPVLFVASMAAQSRLPQKPDKIAVEPTVAGITIDAKQYPRFDDLRSACLAAAPNPCAVTVNSPLPLQLAPISQVPANMHVHFALGGQWQLSAGTLDFSGSTLDTPINNGEAQPIFTGPGKVVGLNEASPEWFVAATGDVVPAAGLAAAYNATVAHGTIQLSARSYVSPFIAVPQSISPHTAGLTQVVYDSPRTFLGAGRPLPDSDTAPTHLVGGTILLGQVVGTAPIVVEHLGIDDGPQVASTYFGGFVGHGLAMFGTGKLQGTGTRIEDVSVLTGAGESTHSIMVEGQSEAAIDGLWLWSLGGLHGLVIKSSHTIVHDFHCKGSAGDCLILKSDFATSRAGYAADDTLSGLYFSYLKTPGDTGGIVIDSTWDTVHDVTLSDVHLNGLSYGLQGAGSLLFKLRNLHLDHWTAKQMTGRCVDLVDYKGADLSDIDCALATVKVPEAFRFDGADTRLSDIIISCSGPPADCAAAGTAGISLLSSNVSLNQIYGSQLGGPLVQSTTPLTSGQIAQLSATALHDPLAAAYIAPHRSLGERARKLKPPLRIAYTWTLTRLHEHKRLTACGALLVLIVITIAGARRRRA